MHTSVCISEIISVITGFANPAVTSWFATANTSNSCWVEPTNSGTWRKLPLAARVCVSVKKVTSKRDYSVNEIIRIVGILPSVIRLKVVFVLIRVASNVVAAISFMQENCCGVGANIESVRFPPYFASFRVCSVPDPHPEATATVSQALWLAGLDIFITLPNPVILQLIVRLKSLYLL